MGWLYGWDTRKQLVDHLIKGNGVTTLKHCFKGNNLWAVQEGYKSDGTPIRFIGLYLLRGSNGSRDGWGYKDMDESAGPYYFNCPLSYLDMVACPGGHATEWREGVRAYHAKANQKLVAGQRIMLYGKEYTVGQRENGHQYIWEYDSPYILPKRMLKHVEVLL
jgi:hypothetical protein